jgi:hypothetical protein
MEEDGESNEEFWLFPYIDDEEASLKNHCNFYVTLRDNFSDIKTRY